MSVHTLRASRISRTAEYAFAIDPFRKECLLAGTDNISFTLGQSDQITAFEKGYERKLPWM